MSTRFDDQADRYDRRAGFPATVGARVAAAILGAVAGPADAPLIEIGAGTGLIGRHLAAADPHYVGADLSAPMLRRFAASLRGDSRPVALVRFDCAGPWPLADGAARAVVASRIVHLVDRRRLAAEIRRVCRAGGSVVVGRVERDPDAMKSRLRRRRRQLLRQAGIAPRDGRGGTARFVAELVAAGAVPLGRQPAAAWRGTISARRIIDDWRALPAMGGATVPAEMGQRILEALTAWADAQPGGLDREEPFEERYVLEIVRLP